jgi:hypothetical protein
MRKSLFVFVVATLVASLSVHAQKTSTSSIRYRWHDAQGLPHYSDSLSAEAMKYGYDLVNDQGMVIQHVQRQLTVQERAAAQQAAAQRAAQQRAAQERVRADVQMLNAYPDEASFQQSQQQELDSLDQQINTTRINLHSQEKALTDLLTRAADLERAKQPVPKFLADSIANQRNVVAGQRAALERQQTAREVAAQHAEQQLQHYRELKAAQAQPSS